MHVAPVTQPGGDQGRCQLPVRGGDGQQLAAEDLLGRPALIHVEVRALGADHPLVGLQEQAEPEYVRRCSGEHEEYASPGAGQRLEVGAGPLRPRVPAIGDGAALVDEGHHAQHRLMGARLVVAAEALARGHAAPKLLRAASRRRAQPGRWRARAAPLVPPTPAAPPAGAGHRRSASPGCREAQQVPADHAECPARRLHRHREGARLGHSRRHVDLEEEDPAAGDDEVGTGQVAQAQRPVGGDGRGRRGRRLVRGEPGRGVEPCLAGRVPRRIVVAARQRVDLDHGQRLRALTEVDHPDGDLGAHHAALDQCRVAIGETADHGARQVGGGLDPGRAQRRPAAGGLDEQGQPERGHDAFQHSGRTKVVEGLLRQRDGGRGRQPSGPDDGFRHRLVESEAAGIGRRPDERHPQQRQHLLDRPVLPAGAVDGREDRAGGIAGDRGDQRRVRVGDAGLDARFPQCVAQPAARAQRHLPLGGQPTGQDEHVVQVTHCAEPAPAGPVRLTGPAPEGRRASGAAPNVSRNSISVPTTSASRRTPSLIRPGSGKQ